MKNHLLPLLLSILGHATLLHGEPELKGTPGELSSYLSSVPRTITLHASGEIKVQADKAIVTVIITSEDEKLALTIEKNNHLRDDLTNGLLARGLTREQISTGKFTNTPQQGLFSSRVKSYKIENSVLVIIHDDSQFAAIAAEIDKNDKLSYSTVRFEHSLNDKNRLNALALALANLNDKKNACEKGLQISLKLLSFKEDLLTPAEVLPPMPRYAMKNKNSMSSASSLEVEPSAVSHAELATMGLGEITYAIHVHADYNLQ